MSHFTVLVIGDYPEDQLAPYQENNMGDCPKEYMEFIDNEDNCKNEYETEEVERVKASDGSLHSPWDHTKFKDGFIPKDYAKIKIPLKELYSTFEEYMEKYEGRSERDPETKRYGYWRNPNTKWDWYMLGGRWEGYFKLKESAYMERTSSQVCEEKLIASKRKIQLEANTEIPAKVIPMGVKRYSKHKNGYVDAAYWGDIDIEAMRDEAAQKAKEKYQKVLNFFEGDIPKLDMTWDYILENYKDLPIDKKRNMYYEQSAYLKHKEAIFLYLP